MVFMNKTGDHCMEDVQGEQDIFKVFFDVLTTKILLTNSNRKGQKNITLWTN